MPLQSWGVTVGDLAVTVRLNGVLVEDRVIAVYSLVRLGEATDAVVPFPGADVAVVRLGKRLALRGRTLEEGEEMEIALGATLVHLRHTHKFSPPSAIRATLDTRFLVAALLVMVIGSWIDAAEYWLDHHSHSKQITPFTQILQVFSAVADGEPDQLAASVSTASEGLVSAEGEPPYTEPPRADGPRHVPDDSLTGTGYYEWYRLAVLQDDQVEAASLRFLEAPSDPAVRRIMARGAYDRDDFEAAAWHYRWLVDRFPDDRAARIRLARTEKRLGFHQREVELYREVLRADPQNIEALSGVTLALTRLGRLDEAQQSFDELLVLAPMHPYTEITTATIAALMGRQEEALQALERGFISRAQLSRELQIEMRRDIALDPAFKSLRNGARLKDSQRTLRGMLMIHLGAAAPRPVLSDR